MHDPIEFPDDIDISSEAMDFVRGLLTRDISQRLGFGPNGFRRLQQHPWFKEYDWNQLETKQGVPPFIPDVRLFYSILFHFYYIRIHI